MSNGLLFDTPGLNLSTDALEVDPTKRSKKRKRQTAEEQIEPPAVNVERLLNRYHALTASKLVEKPSRENHNGQGANKEDRSGRGKRDLGRKRARKSAVDAVQAEHTKTADNKLSTGEEAPNAKVSMPATANKRQRQAEKRKAKVNANANASSSAAPISSTADKQKNEGKMTDMQIKMKGKLNGARFRWINEKLYTTSGDDAFKLMQDDPDVFSEYHTGFRSQASAWPVQPVEYIISSLSLTAKGSVIADIGCGDAQIAQDLSQKGYKVISYDLVSVNEWVVAAQCAGVIPLPGSGDDKKTHAAVVDIAVCCLSLMGTDWIKQIQEARRVLKAKGQLKVAEVTSRFGKGGPSAFAKAVESVGFKLLKQEAPNTYFTVFDYQRVPRQGDMLTVQECEGLLKPCTYRKR